MNEANRRDKYNNYTPLHETAATNAVDDAKLLLANGADVNAKAESKSVGLHVSYARDAVNPGSTHVRDTITPLQEAARVNAVDVVKLLLENGADVNACKLSRPALCLAAKNGAFNVAKLLLENGADVNCGALSSAAHANAVDVAKLLLENGANVDYHALCATASANAVDVAKLLLENGADANAKYTGMGTPLNVAAKENALDVAELLLAYGADVNASDYNNPTPFKSCGEKECNRCCLPASCQRRGCKCERLQRTSYFVARGSTEKCGRCRQVTSCPRCGCACKR